MLSGRNKFKNLLQVKEIFKDFFQEHEATAEVILKCYK